MKYGLQSPGLLVATFLLLTNLRVQANELQSFNESIYSADSNQSDKKTKENTSNDDPPAKPLPIRNQLKFGADLYYGVSNAIKGRSRFNDGIWAGYGSVYPSLLSFNWQADEAHSLRVSLGVGDLFTASGTPLRQPVEATYQFPVAGGGTMTVGKFYVPFGVQEWEYESKYGALFQSAHGATSFTGSLNYNFSRNAPNIYLRIGRQFTPRTTVGVSTGGGRGVFSDSSHALAFGLDLTHDFGSVQLSSEFNFADGASGSFQYVSGKLTFTKTGRFLPYLGAYYWHDSAQELGNFSSLGGGLGYRMNRFLTVEGGYSRANSRNVFWFQSHITI